MSVPSIRRAAPPDAEHVWPLARDFATSFTPVLESFEPTFAQVLESPQALLLVAESSAGIVGYLLAHRHDTFLANGPVAWVEEVMVAEHDRRGGTGRALMDAAEAWASDVGCAYVALASRRAGGFYLALDYEESATFFKKTLGL